jgi:hypothetical protein
MSIGNLDYTIYERAVSYQLIAVSDKKESKLSPPFLEENLK